MFTYETLKNAANLADKSDLIEIEDWAAAEGLDPTALTRFSIEEAFKTLPTVPPEYLRGDPGRIFCAAVAAGIIAGLRYANLIEKNPTV